MKFHVWKDIVSQSCYFNWNGLLDIYIGGKRIVERPPACWKLFEKIYNRDLEKSLKEKKEAFGSKDRRRISEVFSIITDWKKGIEKKDMIEIQLVQAMIDGTDGWDDA